MEIKYGLISCDSHAQLARDAFTSHMSQAVWGDRIPHVVEVEDNGRKIERWSFDGKIQGGAVVNCPAAMPDRQKPPTRWEEVPPGVYDPPARLKALDGDGIDAEVLFPNTPVQGLNFAQTDPEFEVACIQAYNDALGEWRQYSDRYVPLALIPYLSPIEVVVQQVERAVEHGHRGIAILADPRSLKNGKPLNDPFWDPLWDTCQSLAIPVNWHAGSGTTFYVPHWPKYSYRQWHTAFTGRIPASVGQMVPFLLFSGILARYPRLKWVLAESATGWMAYVLESCDHEWERRRLWTQGMPERPSDTFRRQIHTSFWFEQSGIELRDLIGVDRILWESDYPHITSTFPDSQEHVERVVGGVPDEERRQMLYQNAMRLYDLA
jgi:predicted TIM-barrel fold metal-dependent hydrolase